MLEAGIMLILHANDAVSEAGQLTDELQTKFSQENNRRHWTVLNSAINDACSHAAGNEREERQNVEYNEYCTEV